MNNRVVNRLVGRFLSLFSDVSTSVSSVLLHVTATGGVKGEMMPLRGNQAKCIQNSDSSGFEHDEKPFKIIKKTT